MTKRGKQRRRGKIKARHKLFCARMKCGWYHKVFNKHLADLAK